MNILGMGPLELLLILALALIVFGPEKLPEIGAQIGRMVRDFRRATSELSEEFNRSLKLELEEKRNAARTTPPPPPRLSPPGPEPPAESAQPAPAAEGREVSDGPGAEAPPTKAQVSRSEIEPPY